MRKVLSFVLVLTLVLSSFSMAFAADTTASLTDISGIANEDAIQVNYDLGIITGNPDGTFLPEKAVNRAEFAAMLTRALDIPASALAGYTSTSFKDTTGYGWAVPYIAFCQSKGILIGDGFGNVMPGRTVSVNEAMTMALRAIGYTENSSLLVGVWPANYVSIAQNEGLYDDVATTTTVNKASAAQIIYNLLTVQKVAVNSDGTTEYLWVGKEANGIEANLLNTNLGCTADENQILGVDYDYSNSLINITGKIGSYGTAYYNSDDDLVAFTVDSTALTGKVDGTQFKVGDTKYDFGTNGFITEGAVFTNTDNALATGGTITRADIAAYAAANADNGKTVTINVDLSGKKIKDIYSVVAWDATTTDLAASDVQEDITEDSSLLGEDFALDDNDDIKMNSFELDGVASLSKIAEDNVVYVYADNAGDIRKVAVGTETVEGTVEETDADTATIAGKDYDIAANAVVAIPADIDVDSEGTFYLDVNGEIYDFDGTGSVNTYGVVKAAVSESQFDNQKLKLYKSDDSTSTLYFADKAADIDWTTTGGLTASAVTTGALIGYSLNADGDIDTIDNTVVTVATGGSVFQSTKVIYIGATAYGVDSSAAVFTYKNNTATTADYDVAKLSDIDTGSIAGGASFIINENGKIAAMFIDESNVTVDDDDVYGVLNTRTSAKTGDDDVYKFVGFIDGTSFTKKTDDRTGFPVAGTFDLYKITVDANDVITAAAGLGATAYAKDTNSGYVVTDVVLTGVSSDKTTLTVGANKYTVADDAVVYLYDAADDEFTVSKLSSLRTNYTVSLFDTKGEDANGVATVVIYMED